MTGFLSRCCNQAVSNHELLQVTQALGIVSTSPAVAPPDQLMKQ